MDYGTDDEDDPIDYDEENTIAFAIRDQEDFEQNDLEPLDAVNDGLLRNFLTRTIILLIPEIGQKNRMRNLLMDKISFPLKRDGQCFYLKASYLC